MARHTPNISTRAVGPGQRRLRFASFVSCLILVVRVVAQGEGLYGPGIPDDAAFVRVVHAAEGAAEVTVTIGGGLSGNTLAYTETSDYQLVIEGEVPVVLELADDRQELTFEATTGGFYTLALVGPADAPETRIIEDSVNDNLARALIALYNFTDTPLDLRTADGETDIVTAVGSAETAGTLVNPITVDLGVFEGGEPRYSLEGVQLEAGGAYSVMVFGAAGDETVTLVEAAGGN